MSNSFLKKREKRRRPSLNQNNISFVKNVTLKISGLLPTTITKWFSSPSSSNTNGSTPTAEASDSSSEDEGHPTSVITQPPAKRMRYNSPNYFTLSPEEYSSSTLDLSNMPVNLFPGHHFAANRTSFNATSMRSDIIQETPRDPFRARQHAVTSLGPSVAYKRKSIFERTNYVSPTNTSGQPSMSKKKPSNRPTLGSPFYPGRTIYGGAASSYINEPNFQQHTVALVNETASNDDTAMSSSARRVLDLLEAYSSPLTEARRIPQYTRPKIENYYSSTFRSTKPDTNRSLSYKGMELNVPSIASILSLKKRSRLMDATKTARQIIASHSSASRYPAPYPTCSTNTVGTNTEETFVEPQSRHEDEIDHGTKMTTKVKTRVARTNRGNQDQFEIATPVKLPSATLLIDNTKLPNFSFDTPTVIKLATTSTPKVVIPVSKSTETKNNNQPPTSKIETATSNINKFKFSDPIEVSSGVPDPDLTPPKFKFGSPERSLENYCNESKSVISSVIGKVKETDKSTNKAKDWQCPDCWVNNKSDVTKCACCGYTQQPKVAMSPKCSACKLADCDEQKDKCVNCEKIASPPLAKTSQSSTWKCDGCWIVNADSLEKCPCCGGSKPNEASKAAKAALAAEIAAFPKVKAPTCGGCFTIDASDSVVPAVNDVKSLPISNSFFGSTKQGDSKFVSLAKTQTADKWECSSCLVRNNIDKTACACCGVEKDPKSKIPDNKFNFGLPANTSFKFGIDPIVQEVVLAKKPVTSDSKLKEQSETNNNVLTETPTFTFALPNKRTDIKIDAAKYNKAIESVKFSFGIPKDVSAPRNKSESSKTVDEQKESLQEVPEVDFDATIESKQTLTPLFTPPTTQETDKNKPMVPSTNMFTVPSVEAKQDTPSLPMTVKPVETSTEKLPTQNSFPLGRLRMKLTTDLFNTPPTISNTMNLFASPSQSSAPSTIVSSLPSLLPIESTQKSEVAIVTSAFTLQAPVMPAPALPASVVPTVPSLAVPTSAVSAPLASIFSFGNNSGNNTAVASASAEIPKLQFTFGSNNAPKTDSAPALLTGTSNAQPVFKSLFAPAGESSAQSTNAFSLTPNNALVPTNNLSNTLTGSNGISATNGLVGNSPSGTPMGGDMMSTNALGVNLLGGSGLSTNLLSSNNMTNNVFASNNLTSGTVNTATNPLGGANGLAGNTHSGGNGLQSSNCLPSNSLTSNTSNIFGGVVQKENMWNSTPNNNVPSTNVFGSNSTANSLQKPPAFSFGTTTPFSAPSSTPAFGSTTQPAQNMFGMSNQNNTNNSQMSHFPTPIQNQASLFGAPQSNNTSVPQMGMFGSPTLGSTPAFGTQNAVPNFEAQAMSTAPTPAFNFGAQAQAPPSPMFGFGQPQQPQPQHQQEQPSGVYSFGGAQQVQFSMGTASNIAPRRIRKAARRTPR